MGLFLLILKLDSSVFVLFVLSVYVLSRLNLPRCGIVNLLLKMSLVVLLEITILLTTNLNSACQRIRHAL